MYWVEINKFDNEKGKEESSRIKCEQQAQTERGEWIGKFKLKELTGIWDRNEWTNEWERNVLKY